MERLRVVAVSRAAYWNWLVDHRLDLARETVNNDEDVELGALRKRQRQRRVHLESGRLLLAPDALKSRHVVRVRHERDEGPVAAQVLREHLETEVDDVPVVALGMRGGPLHPPQVRVIVHAAQQEADELLRVLLLVTLQHVVQLTNSVLELLRVNCVARLPQRAGDLTEGRDQLALVAILALRVDLSQVTLLLDEVAVE